MVLAANLALLEGVPQDAKDPSLADRMTTCLGACAACVTELLASADACSVVEAHYLAGHPALFPDEGVRFTNQLEATQRQTVLVMRLAELDGLPPGEPGHPEAVAARADELVGDLVEPAKVTALEKLGDGRQPLSIATR